MLYPITLLINNQVYKQPFISMAVYTNVQTATIVKDTILNSCCSFCPSHALDPLGHHALDPLGHHALDSKVELIQPSDTILCGTTSGNRFSWPWPGRIEAGSGLDAEGSCTRPADIFAHNSEFGKPAALDFTITSPLNHSTSFEREARSVMAGSAASAAELRKHAANDDKYNCLGWVCIPLAVETYGCWVLGCRSGQMSR